MHGQVQKNFMDHGLTHICVVDKDEKLVGLISQKYLYKAQSPRKIYGEGSDLSPELLIDGDSYYDKDVLDSYILRHVMRKNPETLSPEESLDVALSLMSKKKLGFVPIVDDKLKICGSLNDRGIVDYLAKVVLP